MKKYIVIIFSVIIVGISFGQSGEKKISLFVGVDYTTSGQIYLNPNSSDIIIRNRSFELVNLYSPVFDFRYALNSDLIIGLSSEYISKSENGFNQTVIEGSQIRLAEVEDGVVFIPIELSLHYLMPFSTEQFKFTMGGGFGYYFGSHTRILGDTKIKNIKRNNSFEILVSIGMEYIFLEQFGVRLDLKFRDPEVKVTSIYENSSINYNGRILQVTQDAFDTKINLNGISFVLGTTLHF
jgi:outer membrane protein W